MSTWIKKLTEAFSEVNEKKKMDPVGQEDGDIDNDGDKDSSDEYLAKRRKAIGKAMKENDDEGEERVECPKCKGEGCDHCDGKGYHTKMDEAYESVAKEMKKMHDEGYGKKAIMAKYNHMDKATLEKLYASSCGGMRESAMAQKAKDLAKASEPSAKGKKSVTLPKAPWDKKKQKNEEEVIMNPKKEKDKKAEAETMATESALPPVYARIMEDRAKRMKGATPPEGMMDNSKSSRGAMDMVNQPKDINNDDEKGHDDVSKAGRVGPSAKARPGDNMKGDKKVIPSATPMKGK